MSDQRLTTITRKARLWPEIPTQKLDMPSPPHALNTPNPLMLITVGCSMLGITIYAVFILPRFGGNGFFFLGMLVMSGSMFLGAILNFFLQWLPARRQLALTLAQYQAEATAFQKQVRHLHAQEQQSRLILAPPFVSQSSSQETTQIIEPIIQRRFDNHDLDLWARRPHDEDFLSVRIGMGIRTSGFQIKPTQKVLIGSAIKHLSPVLEEMKTVAKTYTTLRIPVAVNLLQHNKVAILGTGSQLRQARQLAQALVADLSYHHSPEDVRIILLAPENSRNYWDWTQHLPHTLCYDPRTIQNEQGYAAHEHAVAIGNEAVLAQLPHISREISRRELLMHDIQPQDQQQTKPCLPHLLIVIDHFDEAEDLDYPTQFLQAAFMPARQRTTTLLNRPRLSVSPLRRPELTLALYAPDTLGVTVLAVCNQQRDIPETTNILLDIGKPQEQATQVRIHQLTKERKAPEICEYLDEIPLESLRYFATKLAPLQPAQTKRLELRTHVDLCTLFEPAIEPTQYNPLHYWQEPMLRSKDGAPLLRVPIGLKMGDEIQYLDLLKDGPHGLLIGQTGSGKSELLQTVIASLAISYHPGEVNFLLIDYKAGLALEPFQQLPHTIGFLSNVSSQALIQRFVTMLRAEATRRELRIKEGKPTPRLVIIIDEFAEMAKRTESVLEELFTITRVGREIGMHLLLAAQRPEGIIGHKVRDYVQYRFCLRCASPEDSREVLRRVDAASLPASIPGRGYLLHGDNQLELFQAARVTIPFNRLGKGLRDESNESR